MSTGDTEAGGIVLLHRQGEVNKSRDVGLMEPNGLDPLAASTSMRSV